MTQVDHVIWYDCLVMWSVWVNWVKKILFITNNIWEVGCNIISSVLWKIIESRDEFVSKCGEVNIIIEVLYKWGIFREFFLKVIYDVIRDKERKYIFKNIILERMSVFRYKVIL